MITFNGVMGMTQINTNTYLVTAATATQFTIALDSSFPGFGIYTGGGIATPYTVYSPNHMLNNGDYIIIDDAIGTVATTFVPMTTDSQINGQIFEVQFATANEFNLGTIKRPNLIPGTYLGLGVIIRMYVPQIQTKQFPVQWGMARRTRLGPQQYLFTTTDDGQITLQIFLSQNAANPYNLGPIVPKLSINNALIYSDILYTSPNVETTAIENISLGPIGNNSATTININFPVFLVPGSLNIFIGSVATFMDNSMGVLAATGTGLSGTINYRTGAAVLNFSVAPNAQPSLASYSYYAEDVQTPTSKQQAQIWQRMNTSLIGDTVQIGFTLSPDQMTDPNFDSQFAEIELHSIILDVSPASVLA